MRRPPTSWRTRCRCSCTNLTGNRYGTFGTFYDSTTSGTGVSPTLRANDPANSGVGVAQSLIVAQPRAVYGGTKVTF